MVPTVPQPLEKADRFGSAPTERRGEPRNARIPRKSGDDHAPQRAAYVRRSGVTTRDAASASTIPTTGAAAAREARFPPPKLADMSQVLLPVARCPGPSGRSEPGPSSGDRIYSSSLENPGGAGCVRNPRITCRRREGGTAGGAEGARFADAATRPRAPEIRPTARASFDPRATRRRSGPRHTGRGGVTPHRCGVTR